MKEAVWAVNLFYCNDSDDGNWNAFKHAFWAAMLCDHINPSQALMITENHEESDTYNSLNAQQKADFELRKDMDLDNNQLGINTYKGKKSTIFYLSYPVRLALIANAILDKISNGYGTRIITDSNKNPLYKTQTTNEDRCL